MLSVPFSPQDCDYFVPIKPLGAAIIWAAEQGHHWAAWPSIMVHHGQAGTLIGREVGSAGCSLDESAGVQPAHWSAETQGAMGARLGRGISLGHISAGTAGSGY